MSPCHSYIVIPARLTHSRCSVPVSTQEDYLEDLKCFPTCKGQPGYQGAPSQMHIEVTGKQRLVPGSQEARVQKSRADLDISTSKMEYWYVNTVKGVNYTSLPGLGVQLRGRAFDCRSRGPWFKSRCPLLFLIFNPKVGLTLPPFPRSGHLEKKDKAIQTL